MAQDYQSEWRESSSGIQFTKNHFGVNIVSSQNNFAENSPFQKALDYLGPTSVRYPGGTITEEYFDPNSDFFERIFETDRPTVTCANGDQVAAVRSTLAYAADRNLTVDFVLPTEHLLKDGPTGARVVDEQALSKLMSKVDGLLGGRYGDVHIGTFEIGNEYFVGGRMTAGEYGMITDRLTRELSSAYDRYEASHPEDTSWHEPTIAVQSGPGWLPDENQKIIDSLSPAARSEIDEVIGHYYPKQFEHVKNFGGFYKNFEAWESAKGLEDVKVFVSEWNVKNSMDADKGLYQASSFVHAFHELGEQNVDFASAWGVQHRNIDSSLTFMRKPLPGDKESPEVYLSATGYMFQQLRANAIGLRSLDLDQHDFISGNQDDIAVTSFGNGDRALVYISSRADTQQTIGLDLDDYFKGSTHIHGMRISAVDDPRTLDINEGNPDAAAARIDVHGVSSAQLSADHGNITLQPGEILQLEVDFGQKGVHLSGFNPSDPLPGAHYEDTFSGSAFSDRIYGFAGDDTIHGLNGRDLLNGGSGHDKLSGGLGNDIALGEAGNDTIYGGLGHDLLRGGDGGDLLLGGDGDDRLDGGAGLDSLRGGAGDDTLVSTEGTNTVAGEAGADLFLASVDADTTISDFDYLAGDRLGFLGHYATPKQLLAHATLVDGADDTDRDVVITHETGHVTRLTGAENQFSYLVAGTSDFSDEAQSALHLADTLNALAPVQIEALLSDMDTKDFHDQIMSVDTDTLLTNLNGAPAGALLKNMLPEEAEEFLNSISDKSYDHFVKSLSKSGLDSFIGNLDNESLKEFMNSLPDETLDYVRTHIETDDPVPDNTGTDGNVGFEPGDDGLPPRLPPQPDDPNEDHGEHTPSLSENEDCFVATAAYRDRQHPDVVLLRQFREKVLRHSSPGRAFIDFYWWIGPKIARPVYRHPTLGRVSKLPLKMIVAYLKWRYRALLT